MESWFWLLLPVAATCGWIFGWRARKKSIRKTRRAGYSPEYYQGLSYLLSEQPDKAIEVFIKLVEVDSDTVETHLALGGLFRRRGEVERAIRIHQNLIARPSLDMEERGLALMELAKDYMNAGLLDRAESLFMELIKQDMYKPEALRNLLEIFQKESDWYKAIEVAKEYSVLTDENMTHIIAHYYCELAKEETLSNNYDKAQQYLVKALDVDSLCVRASILMGDLMQAKGEYKKALNEYLRVLSQDKSYVSEIMNKALQCINHGASSHSFKSQIQRLLLGDTKLSFPGLVQYLYNIEGAKFAEQYLEKHLRETPSLVSLKEWVEQLNIASTEVTEFDKALLLEALNKVLSEDNQYLCRQCGYAGKLLHWRCPSCKAWGTIKPLDSVSVM